jgi:homoserine kinase
MPTRVRVFAPASISNLGPGFDVIGLALHEPGDIVEAEAMSEPGIEIAEITGDGGLLSRDPARNVVGVSAAHLVERLRAAGALSPSAPRPGIRLRLHKRMPISSGLGSSAASSVAGAVAANALLEGGLTRHQLLASALEGERAASGAAHADNVAPSLLGGVIMIRSYEPLDLIELPAPSNLWVAVVHPHHAVSTAEARALLKRHGFPIGDIVTNLGNFGALVSALFREDLGLLGRSIDDRLVEPLRAALIPGFNDVKRAALDAGALGCSIAGAGPSVFAFSDAEPVAARAADAMVAAFERAAKLPSDRYVGQVNAAGATVQILG